MSINAHFIVHISKVFEHITSDPSYYNIRMDILDYIKD